MQDTEGKPRLYPQRREEQPVDLKRDIDGSLDAMGAVGVLGSPPPTVLHMDKLSHNSRLPIAAA